MGGARAVVLSLLLACTPPAFAVPSSGTAYSPEFSSLRSIAGWLKREGSEGWLGADVADALGIPRLATEELLEARQRGFRDDEALRVVQLSADERRDFLLFMVQLPEGRVLFYLASLREGLKGAYVAQGGSVRQLDRIEAEAAFRRELLLWKGRVAAVR